MRQSAFGRFMSQIFLTGATGFLGKVVLAELVRRKEELSIQKIYCLVRPNKKRDSAQTRFEKEVALSPCFSKFSKNWANDVEIIEGELAKDCLNLPQKTGECFDCLCHSLPKKWWKN